MTTTQQKNDWIADKMDRVYLLVPRGVKALMKEQADRRFSGSINAYINNLIAKDLRIEEKKDGMP